MATRFTFDLGKVDLEVDEIWPDGDAPKNPTPEDVVKLMRRCGGACWVAKEWNLISGIEVIAPDGARAVYQ